jgi:hypothetical protein
VSGGATWQLVGADGGGSDGRSALPSASAAAMRWVAQGCAAVLSALSTSCRQAWSRWAAALTAAREVSTSTNRMRQLELLFAPRETVNRRPRRAMGLASPRRRVLLLQLARCGWQKWDRRVGSVEDTEPRIPPQPSAVSKCHAELCTPAHSLLLGAHSQQLMVTSQWDASSFYQVGAGFREGLHAGEHKRD